MRTASAVLITILGCSVMPTTDAWAKYAAKLPNGDKVPDAPALGHLTPDGSGGQNAFGKAWSKYTEWTTAYCMADSDGDGFTNGQELGDPCCKWTVGADASLITDGISHPGDAKKTPTNEKLKKACGAGDGASGAGTVQPSSSLPGGAGGATGGGATGGGATGGGAATNNAGGDMPPDDDEDDRDISAPSVRSDTNTRAHLSSKLLGVVSTLAIVVYHC